MTRFHPTSFVLGVGTAVVLIASGRRLRPVFVELAAVGVHLGKLGLALLERKSEVFEDLWAEVGDRVRRKEERRVRVHDGANGAAQSAPGTGAPDLEAP